MITNAIMVVRLLDRQEKLNLYNEAVAFYELAECGRINIPERKNIESYIPYIVNMTFATELFLKLLLIESGKTIDAVVKLENEKSITYVIDWFGSNTKIFKKNNNTYAKIKCDDEALTHWLLQYINYVKIEEPLYLKEKVINILKDNLNTYLNE